MTLRDILLLTPVDGSIMPLAWRRSVWIMRFLCPAGAGVAAFLALWNYQHDHVDWLVMNIACLVANLWLTYVQWRVFRL